MPELCRFYGIVIRMYPNDHGPPHFHALYGEDEILVGIDTLSVLQGKILPRARGLVIEWASIHQAELREAWNRAQNLELPGKIAPLECPATILSIWWRKRRIQLALGQNVYDPADPMGKRQDANGFLPRRLPAHIATGRNCKPLWAICAKATHWWSGNSRGWRGH